MKKSIMLVVAALFVTSILTSCGSIESDAKKLAKLQCEVQELTKKASSGDASVMQESMELASEAAALGEELKGKYTSDADRKEFTEAFLKEMGNCD